MLTRAVVVTVTAAVAAIAVAGCRDSSDGDDAGAALADRVSAILESDSSAVVERLAEGGSGVDADAFAGADVECPAVDDPQPGDLATCRVTAGGTELELDVEFQPDGAIEVVALAVAP